MDFKTLYRKVSSRLKWIARKRSASEFYGDENDLYQEMCMHLWEKFKDGAPDNLNESYIVKGCEFHILNYIRKKREKVSMFSMDEPLNENGASLKDLLASETEAVDRQVDKKLVIETIMNNGFTPREKQVLSLLLDGYTTREAGRRLGISHVMVTKLKKSLINRWHKKEKGLPC